jgi:LysW-gamma-L-lysine carboxypeptidase
MDGIAFLEGLVSIPSPSGQEDAVAAYLLRHMSALGFDAGRDEAGNVVGTVGNPAAKRTIALVGHMDTVPGEVAVRRSNGKLFGRGTVDAKGPLAALILAAAHARQRLNGSCVRVIGAVEEEAGSRGARHLASTLPAPFCAIVGEPSSFDGITLGYKGVLRLDYRLTLPHTHSAGKFPGAAATAVTFWNNLVAYAAEKNSGQYARFHTIDPALRTFNTRSDGLYEVAEMSVAIRIPPEVAVSELTRMIARWSRGATVNCHLGAPPYRAEKNTPVVRALLQAIRVHGGQPRFKLKTGTADMNIVGPAWGCPIAAYGPGDASLDHTPHEHIDIAEFQRSVAILTQVVETLIHSE